MQTVMINLKQSKLCGIRQRLAEGEDELLHSKHKHTRKIGQNSYGKTCTILLARVGRDHYRVGLSIKA